jgi:translation initiation factor IF-2
VATLKVFEFAKEVGMTPLALMDRIKEWNLPVKSHMAELNDELQSEIRRLLNPEPSASEPGKTKATKVIRKKMAGKSAASDSSAKVVVPRPIKAGALRAGAAKAFIKVGPPEESAGAQGTEVAPSSPAVKRVVRRKKLEEVETPAAGVVEGGIGERSSSIDVVESVLKSGDHLRREASPQVQVNPGEESGITALTPGVVSEPALVESPAKVVIPEASTTSVQTASATPSVGSGISRKKEVTIGQSGVASVRAPLPAVRRNIVGKLDLSKVQGPSHDRGSRPPSLNIAAVGQRNKSHIRAGFVQAGTLFPPPPVDFDEEFRKKEERRKTRGETGVGQFVGDQPPEFDAAEFRKREMVFQPKKKKDTLNRPAMQTKITEAAAHKRILKVYGSMKIQDIAKEMGIKLSELTKVLMKNGVMQPPTAELDFDTIALVLPELKWEAQNVQRTSSELEDSVAFGDLDAEPVTRPPVVAVMGHVDHGKTSLLDAIRSSDVASREAGGITQHIGAYQVSLPDNYKITFLDTPGHEAFTQMRARGAHITDIAIIVVAADDGMMPQTKEAISHAKAAGVPMIVAVNKMDKPQANPDRVMQQLTEMEVVPEEWGGETIFVKVSALAKTGISELLERIKLLAEMAELKANPKRSASGRVIEARLDKARGPVATFLVREGTLKVGDLIVAGAAKGKVRSLANDQGQKLTHAAPGTPVEVLGLEEMPSPGDRFDVVKDEETQIRLVEARLEEIRNANSFQKKVTLEEIFARVKAGDVKELVCVLKADVQGSLEAVQGLIKKIETPEVKVRLIHSACGGITESDVLLAATAKGLILGFNVRPDTKALQKAKEMGVEVRTYSIVYEMMDDLKKALGGLLAPKIVERILGRAEVRNTFALPKVGTIAGLFVVDGKMVRSSMVRVIRNGTIIYEGKISSLKRFKDDVREVVSGFECGLGVENFNDIKVGDTLECFTKEEVQRTLEGSPSNEANP